MSSRCQLQVKTLAALGVVGITVGAIVLLTADYKSWALDSVFSQDPEDIKALAGFLTVLGGSYLLCLASCCCRGECSVKVLAVLSPPFFLLSAVAYLGVYFVTSFTPEAEYLAPGVAVFIFLGLMVGSLACSVAGCCIAGAHLQESEPSYAQPRQKGRLCPQRLDVCCSLCYSDLSLDGHPSCHSSYLRVSCLHDTWLCSRGSGLLPLVSGSLWLS